MRKTRNNGQRIDSAAPKRKRLGLKRSRRISIRKYPRNRAFLISMSKSSRKRVRMRMKKTVVLWSVVGTRRRRINQAY